MDKIMRIGTRRSVLALAQTELFIERCRQVSGEEILYEIVEMSTTGDRILDRPLYEFAGKGMFVSAFEEALLEGKIHVAVHSGKDMPLCIPEGLSVGAVLPRGSVEDVLVTLAGKELTEMSVIGTGSLRRREQVREYLGYETKGIRGNVITRLKKLKEGEVDGLILAAAGLERLSILPVRRTAADDGDGGGNGVRGNGRERHGEFDFIRLDKRTFLPAAAQGIIAVECCDSSPFTRLLQRVNDEDTMHCFLTERAYLAAMGVGCEQPVAAFSRCSGGNIHMEAAYLKDGRGFRFADAAKTEEGARLGGKLAARIQAAAKDGPWEKTGHVFLVGAGPGGRDLITVKGMELLRSCDTVIYDRLSGVLSEEVGPDCEKIYAGKRAGHHSISQEEINALLLEKAREGKRVVRLKGGDPFVFGRGGEEAEFLLQHQIPFTVVPGVTSAVAVPEMAGIPVTHREMSRSFHVITAHTAEQDREKIKCYLREQIESLGKAEGTFIFLMGLQYVEMICELLIESGRPPKLPAALISNGTRYREKVIRGTLADIGARIRAENPPSPAVFLAGETAALSLQGNAFLPLQGTRIGIIGTEEMTGRLGVRLREAGAEVLCVQRLLVKEVGNLDRYFSKLEPDSSDRYTWVVFTSGNGVRLFLRQLSCREMDIRVLAGIRLAAIGSGTAQELWQRGLMTDYVPDVYTAEHLAEGLTSLLEAGKDRVLLYQAKDGNPVLEEMLQAANIYTERAAAYRVEAGTGCSAEELTELSYLTFCSSSGVAAFCAGDPHIFQKEALRHVKIFAIGTQTARALEAAGAADVRTGNIFTADGLADAIIEDIVKERYQQKSEPDWPFRGQRIWDKKEADR